MSQLNTLLIDLSEVCPE